MNIPFTPENWPAQMKSRAGFLDLNLDFGNVESTLAQMGVQLEKITGPVYSAICEDFATIENASETLPDTTSDAQKKAVDLLQRTMLHFAAYNHIIYLIARIKNDGVTVKKDGDETTLYRYQQQELQNKLIADGWFWCNELLAHLEANTTTFTQWAESEQRATLKALPVGPADFAKYCGVDSVFWCVNTRWLISEVWTDCVLSRLTVEAATAPALRATVARAVCYETIARAIERLPYWALPETVRRDVNNEQDKTDANKRAERLAETVGEQYARRANNYWRAVDEKIKTADLSSVTDYQTPTFTPGKNKPTDKTVFI